MELRSQRRSLATRLRYVTAIARRFRITFLFGLILFGVLPWLYVLNFPSPDAVPIGFGRALSHVYFLLFGQPSLPYVDNGMIAQANLYALDCNLYSSNFGFCIACRIPLSIVSEPVSIEMSVLIFE